MIKLLRFSAWTLASAYVALSVVVLALFAGPIWYSWHNTIEEGRTEGLQDDAVRLTEVFRERGVDALVAVIDQRVGTHLTGEKIILLADPSLTRLAGNLPSWPSEVPEAAGTYKVWFSVDDHRMRAAFVRSSLPGGYSLLVGRDTARFRAFENLFFGGLAGAAAIVTLIGVLGGLLIRRTLLSEVNSISRTAAAIVEGDLTRRLPTRVGTDELDMLTQTVNRMLDQMEQLIHAVRNVSNSIAHDLRTPLAELRFRLEELSIRRPLPEETFQEIEGAVADVDRVIGIFNALLRLAEIDTGARRSGFVEVDLAKVTRQAAEFYQPVAEVNKITLSCLTADALGLHGDPVMMAQAIGNLIDNAIKYARVNGVITVGASRRSNGDMVISVADDGPGIPDHEKPRVTERFYRADASRNTPGVGLGLSLVAAVAKLHGGSLELTDNGPGLRATLVFPNSGTRSSLAQQGTHSPDNRVAESFDKASFSNIHSS